MPYKNDPRRTVTLNLSPEEFAALSEDALQAGYASPGTYALALVRARGDAPAPIRDQRSADLLAKADGAKRWLLAQFDALQAQVLAAGLPLRLVNESFDDPAPRSWPAQQRAIEQAVSEAVAHERARAARLAKRSQAGCIKEAPDDQPAPSHRPGRRPDAK